MIARDNVGQDVVVTEMNGMSLVQSRNELRQGTGTFMIIFVSYIDEKSNYNVEHMMMNIDGKTIVFVDRNDPILEGANAEKYSLTLYYRER